jgi:hypothetical protein
MHHGQYKFAHAFKDPLSVGGKIAIDLDWLIFHWVSGPLVNQKQDAVRLSVS